MPYITIMQSPRNFRSNIEDDSAEVDLPAIEPTKKLTGTFTRFVENINPKYLKKLRPDEFLAALRGYINGCAALLNRDRHSLYKTFYIPKKTRGYRKIDAPVPELMTALRNFKTLLENYGGPLYHTAAFAYIPGRSTIDAIRKHQQNQSRWFLKTDFSDFFGSTTEAFVYKSFSMIFPFSEYLKHEETAQLFRKALNLCFLDGGLPQGTPISPFLTNLSMLPIDHRIMNDLVKDGYVYTRYADDILISHQYDFDDKKMCRYINGVLQRFEAPFRLKDEKTRYGSSAGKNWNLGVMLNKDNEITIGRKKKLQLRATCNSFVRDTQNGDIWNPRDVQILNGQISYYKMVEPTYIRAFIQWFNQKYKVNLIRMLRDQLK